MKGLSLTQPWASLVAIGAKRVETRAWSTNYRGELLIAAAKKFPEECHMRCYTEPFAYALTKSGFDNYRELPLGVIVAVARLVDVVPTETINALWRCRTMAVTDRLVPDEQPERAFGDYGPDRFAWLLEDVRPLRPPVPTFHVERHGQTRPGGALGLWSVPQVVLDLVAGQGVL